MGSGITYPHGEGPLWLPLVFSALRLPKAQNLVSDKYFDFSAHRHQKQPPMRNRVKIFFPFSLYLKLKNN
jgi:hypothetical protein